MALFLVIGGLWLLLGGSGAEGFARILLGFALFATSSGHLAVWPRDLVLMRHRHRLSDKTTVIGLKSVVDEACPPRSSWLLVRGHLTGGGFIIQGLANGKTRVSFVSEANFGGWAGVYGSYGMHVEQMALLISLKNYVHAEIAAVAGAGAPVVASSADRAALVTNGFEAKIEEQLPVHQQQQQQHQNSLSPGTGFFMSDVSNKLTEIVSQTPDPFRGGNSSVSAAPSPSRGSAAMTTMQLSPAKRPLRHVLQRSTNVDDMSEEDSTTAGDDSKAPGGGAGAGVDLARFPLRVSFELPRPPQYAEQALENRELAARLVLEGPGDGWTQLSAAKGVQVWQKKMGEGRPSIVRGVLADVPCGAGYFLSMSGSTERANWDPMCAKGHLVEVVDEFTSVCYERYHPIFPTSARDFVVLTSVAKRPDGSYLRSAVSVEHPDCPEVSGVVRGQLLLASFLITPNPATGNCDVQYTLHVDLKVRRRFFILAFSMS